MDGLAKSLSANKSSICSVCSKSANLLDLEQKSFHSILQKFLWISRPMKKNEAMNLKIVCKSCFQVMSHLIQNIEEFWRSYRFTQVLVELKTRPPDLKRTGKNICIKSNHNDDSFYDNKPELENCGYRERMDSQEQKGTAEVTMKDENVEDEDTAAVFPEYDISIRGTDFKQECARVTSADSKHVGDSTADTNFEDAITKKEIVNIKDGTNCKSSLVNNCSENKILDCENCPLKQSEGNDDSENYFGLSEKQKSTKSSARMEYTESDYNKMYEYYIEKNSYGAFECIPCVKCFSFKSLAMEHVKGVHMKERRYKCNYCDKSFYKKERFTMHLDTYHKIELCEDDEYFGNISKQIKESESSGLKTQRDVDDLDVKMFDNYIIKNSNDALECITCTQSFVSEIKAKEHVRKVHTNERPFQCHLCPKAFFGQSHLHLHVKKFHYNKGYLCQVCGQSFRKRDIFLTHEKKHLGEPSLACPIAECQKKFFGRENLQVHLKNCHSTTTHICDQCGKTFSTTKRLNIHKARHFDKKVKCPLCPQMFYVLSDLGPHMKHHKEMPWKCNKCFMTFKSSRGLQKHYSLAHDKKLTKVELYKHNSAN